MEYTGLYDDMDITSMSGGDLDPTTSPTLTTMSTNDTDRNSTKTNIYAFNKVSGSFFQTRVCFCAVFKND